ncbi:MAG: AmmeMemoRadiSam system protein B [Syntrophobacterales bacterium]|jgi:poly-gamma-glutamate synthesis protein (capsule biosynthesis protein)|nr:AmmeMemoRadiSam system protein B [Syntrophobacterales bacterium]
MRRLAFLTLILLLAGACSGPDQPQGKGAFPPFYLNSGLFLAPIHHCRVQPRPQQINGVTVPHHLLAADLIAAAFARLQGHHYRRIIILSPDHFHRSRSAFAVTLRDFDTVLGRVANDRAAVRQLLSNPLVSESALFSQEHGVRALLPFIGHYFPQTPVVPLAIRGNSRPADWDSLARTLTPLLTPDTLLAQSTDFSHYLTPAQARRMDQETLRVLSRGSPRQVLALTEPDHLDSKGCQYLQLLLQRRVYHAGPMVIANRNSQEYTSEPLQRTTSYIVQLYSAEPLPAEGAQSYFFGGDTFCGRYVAKKLSNPAYRAALVRQVLKITGGRPLILNLEGVLAEKCPKSPGPYTLCMQNALTLPLLKELHVRAVSLGNNHSHDLGEKAYAAMRRRLSEQGIACLENRQVLDLGPFDLAGFTDVDNQSEQKTALLTRMDLAGLDSLKKDKPFFTLIHWGREFSDTAGPREQALAALLEKKGVEVIIGCHSHRASVLEGARHSCRIFSLGNFLFDQARPPVSGILLEAVFFRQGTYFLKVLPLNNLYATLHRQ